MYVSRLLVVALLSRGRGKVREDNRRTRQRSTLVSQPRCTHHVQQFRGRAPGLKERTASAVSEVGWGRLLSNVTGILIQRKNPTVYAGRELRKTRKTPI